MKIYLLTKHENETAIAYQKNPSHPYDFEGIVSLYWTMPFGSLEAAKITAQQVIDEGFAPLLAKDARVSWEIAGSTLTGIANVPGPDGLIVLSFRIREYDIDEIASHVYIVCDVDPDWNDVDNCLNDGVPYSTLEDAKNAVYRELSISEKEANWDAHLETRIETQIDRPGVVNKIINTWSLAPPTDDDQSHVLRSPLFDDEDMTRIAAERRPVLQ